MGLVIDLPVTLTCGSLNQEDFCEFKARVVYRVKLCLNQTKQKTKPKEMTFTSIANGSSASASMRAPVPIRHTESTLLMPPVCEQSARGPDSSASHQLTAFHFRLHHLSVGADGCLAPAGWALEASSASV